MSNEYSLLEIKYKMIKTPSIFNDPSWESSPSNMHS